MSEKNVLVRWSMDIVPNMTEDATEKAKIALAELFAGFSYSVRHDENFNLAGDHEIELSTETEHWNQKFVLRLIKVNELEPVSNHDNFQ